MTGNGEKFSRIK